ncbi:thioredoxin-disulfide reductase [Patescibacteria group bacterium]|nr:thioredoxin-disulfide reductase [Patescibacteria group bacterium]
MNESSTIFDVIILGSGPSGLTAALYTSRAFLNTLVIAGNPPGGQLTITTRVENFPGFPDGVLGTEFISNARKQVENNGAKLVDENVIKISGSFEENLTVETDAGNIYKTRTIIIATGSSAKWLGLESEKKYIGKGVCACATCDGFFYKHRVVAVVGGGDSAMEESTFLTRFATKVYVIVRKGKKDLRASKYMQKKAFDDPKIEFIFNSVVKEVLGNDVVTGIKIATKNQKDGVEVEEESTLQIDGLFVAIGHHPNTKFLEGLVELDEKGYVKMFENHKTSKEGIFVSGDVHDHVYRQAISAAGYGCQAAIDVTRFLSEHGIETHVSSYQ